MNVTLLAYTQLAPLPGHPIENGKGTPQENLIEYAGRLCYRSDEKMGHSPEFIGLRVREGHEDIIEHASATFLIEGISRSCSHQIVRHRLASFSQESQRYVSLEKGGWDAIVPPSIADNPEAAAIMDEAWEHLQNAYAGLRRLGIPKEDARYLLPNAAETRLEMTMNFRSWRHFLWLRLDRAAQWEVRAVAVEILRQLYPLAPSVFADVWAKYGIDAA